MSLSRAGAVIALCAIAAIGLQARGAFSSAGDAWAAQVAGSGLYDIFGVVIGAATVASGIFLALLLRLRRLRRKNDRGSAAQSGLPWWARPLLVLFALAVIGGPFALLLHAVFHRHAQLGNRLRPLLRPPSGSRAGAYYSGGTWPIVTGVVLAFIALFVAAVVIRRRRAAQLPGGDPDEQDGQAALRSALSAGAAAMRDVADPRGAIIACYAAMEHNLAGAGAAPAAADTPAEILDRAASGGLIRSTAAGELTGLFRQARYGGRAMAAEERTAAEGALARLRSDLAGSDLAAAP